MSTWQMTGLTMEWQLEHYRARSGSGGGGAARGEGQEHGRGRFSSSGITRCCHKTGLPIK